MAADGCSGGGGGGGSDGDCTWRGGRLGDRHCGSTAATLIPRAAAASSCRTAAGSGRIVSGERSGQCSSRRPAAAAPHRWRWDEGGRSLGPTATTGDGTGHPQHNLPSIAPECGGAEGRRRQGNAVARVKGHIVAI